MATMARTANSMVQRGKIFRCFRTLKSSTTLSQAMAFSAFPGDLVITVGVMLWNRLPLSV